MPSYADQAASAIKGLKERGGSSLAAIKKAIAGKNNGDVNAVSYFLFFTNDFVIEHKFNSS